MQTYGSRGGVSGRGPVYLRMLLVLLGLTAFFQAYDSALAVVALPRLSTDFGGSAGIPAIAISSIGLAPLLGVAVAAIADRSGRRKTIIASTALFAAFTGASAAAGSSGAFLLLQVPARVFMTSAYVVAIAMVAEEFPASRRGQAVGLLAAMGALGIAAALVYPLAGDSALGWRYLYLIGLSPLLIAALLASAVRETHRWTGEVASGGHRSLRIAVSGIQKMQMAQVGGLFFLTDFAVLGSATWWAYHAQRTTGLGDPTIIAYLIAGYVAAAIGCLVAGRMQDTSGRKRTGTIFLIAGLAFGIAMFRVTSPVPLLVSLAAALFFGVGVSSVINAYAAELFPTTVRATVIAVSRSVFGTLGAILGPLAVGITGGDMPAGIANGSLVALAMFLPAIFILRSLPETAGRELQDIAASAGIAKVAEAPYAYSARVSYPSAPGPASGPIQVRDPGEEARPQDLFPPESPGTTGDF